MTTSTPPAARAIRKMPMSPSAAASPSLTRCCVAGVYWKRQRRREHAAGEILAAWLVACRLSRTLWPDAGRSPSSCLDHLDQRIDVRARRLDHGRAPRLDLRRHVLDLCPAGHRE